jgi:FkbM family methyltransferase
MTMPKSIGPSRNSFHRLLSKINTRLSPYIRKVKIALNINTEYQYTSFSIALPADHLLPSYQKQNNLYDRFLPHLSKYLEPKSTVIDVGANCGDTLAAMYDANKNLTYICIEPDGAFFGFLQKNVSRIKAIDRNASILTIRSLVGKNVTGVLLEGSGGTKKAIVGDSKNSISSQSLDHILSLSKATNISLIKSDVDGFDYDVIDSADSVDSVLSLGAPIIFYGSPRVTVGLFLPSA